MSVISFTYKMADLSILEARLHSVRASESRARGRGFDPNSSRRVVSLSKIYLPPKSTDNI